MSMMISTALAKGLLDTGSLKDMLAGMKLKLYGGAVPVSADASLGAAVLLSTITVDGSGTALSFEDNAVGNVIQKNSSETWQGTNVATGTATFARLELDSDTGGTTTTEVRIQGDVAIAGKWVSISSTLLTAGAVQSIDSLNIAWPLK